MGLLKKPVLKLYLCCVRGERNKQLRAVALLRFSKALALNYQSYSPGTLLTSTVYTDRLHSEVSW